MEQLILGILLGAVVLAGLGVFAWLIYIIHSTAKAVRLAVAALQRATQVFEKSADMSSALIGLIGVNRKVIASLEAMTAAVQVFTGLVLRDQGGDSDEPPTAWGNGFVPQPGIPPTWRPPAPPFVDEYANLDDAGVMSQSDEDMAEIETQREAEERGEPTVQDILKLQTQDDVRGEV